MFTPVVTNLNIRSPRFSFKGSSMLFSGRAAVPALTCFILLNPNPQGLVRVRTLKHATFVLLSTVFEVIGIQSVMSSPRESRSCGYSNDIVKDIRRGRRIRALLQDTSKRLLLKTFIFQLPYF